MKTVKRSLAAAELVLLFPATLFMTALFVRELQPGQFEPAHTAQRIVAWYAAQPHLGLWLFLVAMPLVVLISGSITVLRTWRSSPELRHAAGQAFASIRGHLANLLVAAATATAFVILAIVALHMITD
jgi:hypothetical protein